MLPDAVKRISTTRRALIATLLGLAAAAVAFGLQTKGWLTPFENVTWSWRARVLARPGGATPKIKLILIDQESLDWAARENGWGWPWYREVYSAIFDFCERGGAAAVGFDLTLTESSIYGVSDDEALAASVQSKPNVVGPVFLGTTTGELTKWPEDSQAPRPIDGLEAWEPVDRRERLAALRASFPIPALRSRFHSLGDVRGEADPDGIFRRAPLFRTFDGRAVLSLGMATYAVSETEELEGQPPRLRGDDFEFGGRTVRLDRTGQAILRYRGAGGTYESFRAAAVIQSELRIREGAEPPTIDPKSLEGCYVLIGASAPGLLDLRSSPVAPVMCGVEIHATVLDNFLSNDFMRDAPRNPWIAVLFLASILAAHSVSSVRGVLKTLLLLLILAAIPLAIGVAMYYLGIWWPVAVTEAGVLLATSAAGIYNYETEGRTRRQIRGAFERYLSPVLVRDLEANPELLKLNGETRTLTILFSDLAGFTSFSERLEAEQLRALLMDYLGEMTDIIYEERGTLDKYEGDAIIAFWNAPLAEDDHALRACRAALKCQRRLAERANDYARDYGTPLRMRIGIHTGKVVVGNLGSRHRFNYTVLGDAANLSSRLEGANKAFGTLIMVSEDCWTAVGGALVGREIGVIQVVGRVVPVRVFEPLAEERDDAPAWLPAYEGAMEHVSARRWDDAAQAFEQIETRDPVSALYRQKCRALAGAAEADWDGIWRLAEK
jgi:adenylate cyclase